MTGVPFVSCAEVRKSHNLLNRWASELSLILLYIALWRWSLQIENMTVNVVFHDEIHQNRNINETNHNYLETQPAAKDSVRNCIRSQDHFNVVQFLYFL